jgi:hypothetical protein
MKNPSAHRGNEGCALGWCSAGALAKYDDAGAHVVTVACGAALCQLASIAVSRSGREPDEWDA